MYYSSMKDKLLALFHWGSMLIPLIIILWFRLWMGLWIFIPLILYETWVWTGTGYTLCERELLIKSGPLKLRIPYEQIKGIRPVINRSSAPALSAKRVEILFAANGRILISPVRTIEFANLLAEKMREYREHAK